MSYPKRNYHFHAGIHLLNKCHCFHRFGLFATSKLLLAQIQQRIPIESISCFGKINVRRIGKLILKASLSGDIDGVDETEIMDACQFDLKYC